MKCENVDIRMNQRIAKEMSVMTVAVGYLQICDTDERSPLILAMIRRVHVNADNYDILGLAGRIDKAFLSVAIDGKVGNRFIVGPEDLVRLQNVYSYAPLSKIL